MWRRVDKQGFVRFVKFAAIGASTFTIDLILLYVFITLLGWYYLLATGISFSIAMTANFALNRLFVFRGSSRALHHAYVRFMVVAVGALILVVIFMYILVGLLHQNYLLSRLGVAAAVGFLHYLFNLYKVFSVAGLHISGEEDGSL